MKFEISKHSFSESVKKVSRGISPRSIVPILSGILVNVTDEGLMLTGSDSDISIRSFVSNDDEGGLKVDLEGEVVLPAKELTQIVRAMPDNSVKVEKIDDLNKVIISSGKSKFTLNGMPAEEYPKIKSEAATGFTIKGEVLRSMIQKTVFATSDSETRPVLTGVNIFFEHGKVAMVATDSHRLARIVASDVENPFEENVIIPERSLKEIPMLIQGNEDIEIRRSDTQVFFETDSMQISSRVLTGQYPETDRLIPTGHTTLLSVNRDGFLASLERSRILAEDKVATFEISNENAGIFETIQLSQRNSEVGNSVEEIIVDSIEGEEIKLAFSADYVIEALKAIDSEKVNIEFSGPMRPFIIRPTDNQNDLQLILPVRTF